MQQNQRTKICPNCEGNIALHESICPYCGSSVFEENQIFSKKLPENDSCKSLSYEETLASLYPPPYKPKAIEPAFEQKQEKQIQEPFENRIDENSEEETTIKEPQSALLPTVLFWAGINIFVFSFILLIFSKDGFLHLSWNASYWYLYALLAIPLLYYGYKGLNDID